MTAACKDADSLEMLKLTILAIKKGKSAEGNPISLIWGELLRKNGSA